MSSRGAAGARKLQTDIYMMRFTRYVGVLLLPVLAACGAEPEPVLVVGDIGYSAQQVAGLSPEQIATLADLTALGQAVADDDVAAVGAPLVERAAERSRLEALPLELAARDMGIGEPQLQAAYRDDPEWELEVQHVVRLAEEWAPEEERAEARRVAEEVRRRAVAGEDFAALAAEFSEEPGAAERGGLLGAGREGTWVDPFWEAARALEPGEISPVVETRYGFHVLRLEDRRPVPFAEADRQRILAGLVPADRAAESMARWSAEQATTLVLDPPAILAAREALAAGEAPDTLVLASWPDGEYTAWDLAVYRASLQGGDRERFDTADDMVLGGYVQADAAEAVQADAARERDVRPSGAVRTKVEDDWERRAARWAAGLGFREGMGEEEIRSAALRALASSGQESRIARLELEAVRPLLRRRYPVSGDAAPSRSAAASSSETRNSESTR